VNRHADCERLARRGFVESGNSGWIDEAEAEFARPAAKSPRFSWPRGSFSTLNPIGAVAQLRRASLVPNVESVELGRLTSFGTVSVQDTRLGADLLVQVLRGATPGELPVHQASRFVLAISLKTARARGSAVPQPLQRADRVIAPSFA